MLSRAHPVGVFDFVKIGKKKTPSTKTGISNASASPRTKVIKKSDSLFNKINKTKNN